MEVSTCQGKRSSFAAKDLNGNIDVVEYKFGDEMGKIGTIMQVAGASKNSGRPIVRGFLFELIFVRFFNAREVAKGKSSAHQISSSPQIHLSKHAQTTFPTF